MHRARQEGSACFEPLYLGPYELQSLPESPITKQFFWLIRPCFSATAIPWASDIGSWISMRLRRFGRLEIPGTPAPEYLTSAVLTACPHLNTNAGRYFQRKGHRRKLQYHEVVSATSPGATEPPGARVSPTTTNSPKSDAADTCGLGGRAEGASNHNAKRPALPFRAARGAAIYRRRRPTLPHTCACSTMGAGGLNFRVRNGNGCGPTAIATGKNYFDSEHKGKRRRTFNGA